MSRLLVINSSPSRERSVSRRMISCFVDSYYSAASDVEIVDRDVGSQPPPHLSDDTVDAYLARTELTARQKAAVTLSDELVGEFLSADVIVIGAPMHNFGVTSGLKAYVDHIVRAGRTFAFGPLGPVGLATGKKLYVLTARGSDYSPGGPLSAMDFQETYLRTIFGFMGVTDVTFIHCQGVAASDAAVEMQLAKSLSAIRSVAAAAHPVRDFQTAN